MWLLLSIATFAQSAVPQGSVGGAFTQLAVKLFFDALVGSRSSDPPREPPAPQPHVWRHGTGDPLPSAAWLVAHTPTNQLVWMVYRARQAAPEPPPDANICAKRTFWIVCSNERRDCYYQLSDGGRIGCGEHDCHSYLPPALKDWCASP